MGVPIPLRTRTTNSSTIHTCLKCRICTIKIYSHHSLSTLKVWMVRIYLPHRCLIIRCSRRKWPRILRHIFNKFLTYNRTAHLRCIHLIYPTLLSFQQAKQVLCPPEVLTLRSLRLQTCLHRETTPVTI